MLAAGLALAVAAPALAQKGMSSGDDEPVKSTTTTRAATKDIRPPAPAEPEKSAIAIPYALTFALGGAAVALAVFPSGRTHQD